MFERGLLIITTFLSSFSLIAQSEACSVTDLRKNAIYLNGDITSALVASTINYERNIFSPDLKLLRHVHARIGYGRWFAISTGGSNYTLAIHLITGLNKHHLEGVLGLSAHFDKIDYQYELNRNGDANAKEYLLYLPQISIGYRFQRPGGILIFRICAGIPYLQCSIGFAF